MDNKRKNWTSSKLKSLVLQNTLTRKRKHGEGNGNPLQYSCLGNPMDRGAWQATVRGVARVGHNLETKPPLS